MARYIHIETWYPLVPVRVLQIYRDSIQKRVGTRGTHNTHTRHTYTHSVGDLIQKRVGTRGTHNLPWPGTYTLRLGTYTFSQHSRENFAYIHTG